FQSFPGGVVVAAFGHEGGLRTPVKDLNPLVGTLTVLIAAAGCGGQPSDQEEESVAHGTSALVTENSMWEWSLSQNGLAQNSLAQNALSQNGLAQNGNAANILAWDGGWDGFALRQFVHYSATCALAPDQNVSYWTQWGWVTEWGSLGMAP